MTPMRYLHLYEDAEGVSHFRDVEIATGSGDFAPPAPPMGVSETVSCARLLFLDLPPGWRDARHPSPRRQFAFLLSGRLRVTAGDGETRVLEAGGAWLMEDVDGAGHASEVVGDAPVRIAIAQLD